MTPTKLGEPFSELLYQFPFVVDSACEPDIEDAPAIFLRCATDFKNRCADLPDHPRTATVRGDHEGITPVTSFVAVGLGDGPESPAVIGSRLFKHREPVINRGILGAVEVGGQRRVGGFGFRVDPQGNTTGLRSRFWFHHTTPTCHSMSGWPTVENSESKCP
jgi:hypothetical protein